MTTHEHPTKPVNTKLLDSTMVLVGESGGLSAIYENAEPSSSMPGIWRVETEHGPLYLDPDEDQDVLDPEGTHQLMQHLREVHKVDERDLQDRTIDPHEGHAAEHRDRDDLDHVHRQGPGNCTRCNAFDDDRDESGVCASCNTDTEQEEPDREASAEQERAWDLREDEARDGLT